MKFLYLALATIAGSLLGPGQAQAAASVERLYVLECGQGHALDRSRWSPGVDVGRPIDLVDKCYLIRHAQGWLMWDTGIAERVAAMPDGLASAGGAMTWRRPRTLASQLAALGIAPADIRLVAVSHTHGDHVGNVDLFPAATVLIQKAEYDWAFAAAATSGNPPFRADHPVRKLDGDLDVFGDGAVQLVTTPGHTPGHQSLLVHLDRTGWLLLSGDAVHFRDNWDNRRVPSMNTNREQTLASLQRIADLVAQHKAQLWINHDKPQGDALKHAPEFYD
jgi:glyoxylase-like metal-dependent hydrolase (beta-lactamase superfamily II)